MAGASTMAFPVNNTSLINSTITSTITAPDVYTDDKNGESVLGERSLVERVVWSTLLVMIIMASLIGNMLVIACVRLHHRLREEKGNVFIVNLSVTDMSSAVVVMASSLHALATDKWQLGPIWCDIVCGMNYVFIIVSMLTLCFISLDRYIAVIHALHYHTKVTRKRIYVLVAYAWFQGLCFGLAPILARWIRYDYWEIVCAIQWHEDNDNTLLYVIIAFAVCFLLPGVVLVFAYCKVMKVAKAHNNVHPQNMEFRPNYSIQQDLTTSDVARTAANINGSVSNAHDDTVQEGMHGESSRVDTTNASLGNGDLAGSFEDEVFQTGEACETTHTDASVPLPHQDIPRRSTRTSLLSSNSDTTEVKAGYHNHNYNGWASGIAISKEIKKSKAQKGFVLKAADLRRTVFEKSWAAKVEQKPKTDHEMVTHEFSRPTSEDYQASSSSSDASDSLGPGGGVLTGADENRISGDRCDNSASNSTTASQPSPNKFNNFARHLASQRSARQSKVSHCSSDSLQSNNQDEERPHQKRESQRTNDEPGNDVGATNGSSVSSSQFFDVSQTVERLHNQERGTRDTTVNTRIPTRRGVTSGNAVKRNYSASSKAVKSLLIVVLAYFICMTPFSITKLYKVIVPHQDALPGYVNLVASIFQYCSSAINPLIYGIFRKDFQKAFVLLLKKFLIRAKFRNPTSVDTYASSF